MCRLVLLLLPHSSRKTLPAAGVVAESLPGRGSTTERGEILQVLGDSMSQAIDGFWELLHIGDWSEIIIALHLAGRSWIEKREEKRHIIYLLTHLGYYQDTNCLQ